MKAQFFIDPTYKVVVQKFGKITNKKLVINMLEELYSSPAYNDTNKILTDFRGVEANANEEEIEEIAYFIKSKSKNNNYILNAILVDLPMETAFVMLYKFMMHDMPNYSCIVCSTEQKASEILSIPIEEIKSLLEN